jgi:hypothetical protein
MPWLFRRSQTTRSGISARGADKATKELIVLITILLVLVVIAAAVFFLRGRRA